MFTADRYRTKAAECAETARTATAPNEIRDLKRSQKAFSDLAKNEDWLADNFEKMIGPAHTHTNGGDVEGPLDEEAIAAIEDRILRCLGAALIMQWSAIPRELQRELFDTAGSFGELKQTASLRGQIARFLHSHQDKDGSAAGTNSPPGAVEGTSNGA